MRTALPTGQNPLHMISLGAGVQSSTMALMAACGDLLPMPTCAIFADTGDEPDKVYEWLAWLETQLPFPVHHVQNKRGRLSDSAIDLRLSKRSGNTYLKTGLPAFFMIDGRKAGLGTRQCTLDFKIEPIRKKQRELRAHNPVVTWIGISLDEIIRMKPSRDKWNTHIWPLIDRRMSRSDCEHWMEIHGYPKPPRSACRYCPYHSDQEWARLKAEEPVEFEKAAQFEDRYQELAAKATAIKGVPYLHRSYTRLREATFKTAEKQPSLFGNECEGMCGV